MGKGGGESNGRKSLYASACSGPELLYNKIRVTCSQPLLTCCCQAATVVSCESLHYICVLRAVCWTTGLIYINTYKCRYLPFYVYTAVAFLCGSSLCISVGYVEHI